MCIEADIAAGTAHEPLPPLGNDDQMQRIERNQPSRTMSHQTPTSVEFAPWSTDVEEDELCLGQLNFDVGAPLITFLQKGVSYSLPQAIPDHNCKLSADFISIRKEEIFRFEFDQVIAFRVLDENGLLELWKASNENPRPAHSTFRARGHTWNRESFLVFDLPGPDTRFSYFVVSMYDYCLEVVSDKEPRLKNIGPALVTTATPMTVDHS
jgi:hypothetical protein